MDKVKEIKTTHAKVLYALENKPETRNSDDLLYIEVCKMIDNDGLNKPFWYVIMNHDKLNYPSIETVGRARRLIQSKRPDLGADVNVYIGRSDNEEIFREYARQ